MRFENSQFDGLSHDHDVQLMLRGDSASDLAALENNKKVEISMTDPRWVLAMRVWHELDGDVLGPERREKLVRMGKTFGLTVFESNLIIAIVQDRARRGEPPHEALSTLSLIRSPESIRRGTRYTYAWKVAGWCAALIAVEYLLIRYLLF